MSLADSKKSEGEIVSNLLSGKTIDEWTEADIAGLIADRIPEGQIVEYKTDFGKNIPKAIASFANSLGGWLFVGISEETDKGKNKERLDIPKEIIGVDDDTPCLTITHIIRDTISPIPIFHPRVIENVEGEKGVLIVYIPADQNTPFITLKDGVVYTRINSSSSPVNDRYVLESLVEKGRHHLEEIEAFCRDDRIVLSEEAYGSKPWLHVYLIPYPMKDKNDYSLLSKEKALELLKLSKQMPDIPAEIHKNYYQNEPELWDFDSVRTTYDSLVFSNFWKAEYEEMATATLDKAELVEMYVDGKAKFHIPLLEVEPERIPGFIQSLSMYGTSNRILELLEVYKQQKDAGNAIPKPHYHFFDAMRVCWHLLALLMFYKEHIAAELVIDTVRLVLDISVSSDYYAVPLWYDIEWVEMTNKMGVGLPILKGGFTSFARNEMGILANVKDFTEKEWEDSFVTLLGLSFGLMMKDEDIKKAFKVIIEHII